MIRQGGAKAISVASSYGDGADRVFLDSPKAEWLWEFAESNDIVVHIHPPMQRSSCKALFPNEYRWVAQSHDAEEAYFHELDRLLSRASEGNDLVRTTVPEAACR